MKRAGLAVALVLCTALAARAHKPSDSYLSLDVRGDRVEGTWDIALRDLDDAIGLDDDGDGAITWGELRGKQAAVFAYALPRLRVSRGGACTPQPGALQVDSHSDGAYAVLRFSLKCPRAEGSFEVAYSLLFDLDPTHRGLVRLTGAGGARTAIFSPERSVQRLDLQEPGGARQIAGFVRKGAWHIISGIDHLLFLLALLLPAVLRREGGRWVPVARLRPAVDEVVRVVAMFTVAHSITLGLAALSVLRLPSRWVVPAIALSVFLAALNNLVPLFRRRLWAFAFGCGLLHGLGFASALVDVGLPRAGLALALLGFNAGVEAGQMAIVAAFLACAFALREARQDKPVSLSSSRRAIRPSMRPRSRRPISPPARWA